MAKKIKQNYHTVHGGIQELLYSAKKNNEIAMICKIINTNDKIIQKKYEY